MSSKKYLIDISDIDFENPIAEIDDIRDFNPQRHEMEQLTAIVCVDEEKHTCLGYKDISEDEFWVRGHMPAMALMPGVIMCEAAAQISSYYTQRFDVGRGLITSRSSIASRPS